MAARIGPIVVTARARLDIHRWGIVSSQLGYVLSDRAGRPYARCGGYAAVRISRVGGAGKALYTALTKVSFLEGKIADQGTSAVLVDLTLSSNRQDVL